MSIEWEAVLLACAGVAFVALPFVMEADAQSYYRRKVEEAKARHRPNDFKDRQ